MIIVLHSQYLFTFAHIFMPYFALCCISVLSGVTFLLPEASFRNLLSMGLL